MFSGAWGASSIGAAGVCVDTGGSASTFFFFGLGARILCFFLGGSTTSSDDETLLSFHSREGAVRDGSAALGAPCTAGFGRDGGGGGAGIAAVSTRGFALRKLDHVDASKSPGSALDRAWYACTELTNCSWVKVSTFCSLILTSRVSRMSSLPKNTKALELTRPVTIRRVGLLSLPSMAHDSIPQPTSGISGSE